MDYRPTGDRGGMVATNGPQAITRSPQAKQFGHFVFALAIVGGVLVLIAQQSPSVAIGIGLGILVTALLVVGNPALAQLRKDLGF